MGTSGAGSGVAQCLPGCVQSAAQIGEHVGRKRSFEVRHGCIEARLDPVEHGVPLIGNPADDPSAVHSVTFALDETLPNEAVHEPGDPRRALDHAIPDRQRRKTVGTRAAENSKHVVLLVGQILLGENTDHVSVGLVGCPEDRDDEFLPRARKGPRLRDLAQDAWGSCL